MERFSDVFTLPALVLGVFFSAELSGSKALFIREGAMCSVECFMGGMTVLKKGEQVQEHLPGQCMFVNLEGF